MSVEELTELLEDMKIDVKIKLAALWAAMMFCYVYKDLLFFYKPGLIEDIMAGATPLGSQESLLGAAILMAIPSVMVFLSVILPAKVNRLANIIVGIVYTGVNVGAFMEPEIFYVFFGIVEVMITLLIVWHAWKWPKQEERKSGSSCEA